jgi:hypothetical protein
MTTQEEQLALISTASLAQTQAVLDLKQSLTLLVTAATDQFTATIARVNALQNVNNTADIDKVLSTLMQEALALKQSLLVSGQNISTVNGKSLLGGEPLVIERSATSLNRVSYDNRNLLRESISEVDDSTVVEGLGLFMWVNSKEEPDDDETCFTTLYGQWLLETPAWDLLLAWSMHETSYINDLQEDEPLRFAEYLLTTK